MDQIATVAFVFLVGVTLCGFSGSLFELTTGARLSFGSPFFEQLHRVQFVLAVITAGPFMLCNDAVEAREAGRVSLLPFIGCALTALTWAMANGVLISATAMRLTSGN